MSNEPIRNNPSNPTPSARKVHHKDEHPVAGMEQSVVGLPGHTPSLVTEPGVNVAYPKSVTQQEYQAALGQVNSSLSSLQQTLDDPATLQTLQSGTPNDFRNLASMMAQIGLLVTHLDLDQQKGAFQSSQSSRKAIAANYNEQVKELMKAAEDDRNAAIASGVCSIVGSVVSIVPMVGSAGQGLCQGVGQIASGCEKYSADMARAEQVKLEGKSKADEANYNAAQQFLQASKDSLNKMQDLVGQMMQDTQSTSRKVSDSI